MLPFPFKIALLLAALVAFIIALGTGYGAIVDYQKPEKDRDAKKFKAEWVSAVVACGVSMVLMGVSHL